MCNIRDNETMGVSFFGNNPDTVSATAEGSRVMIGTESHHVIGGTKHFLLDCSVMIDIVDISSGRIVFLRLLSAYVAMGFGRAHGVECE